EELAAIIQSQIEEGGPAPSTRTPAYRRSLARAESTLGRLLNEVRTKTGLEDPERSRIALNIVLASLVQRLTQQEANDFIAQLPSLLQPDLRALPIGPDKAINEASIEAKLSAQLDIDSSEATRILAAIAGIIAGSISEGQAEDVRGQLPAGFRDMFWPSEKSI